MSTTQNTTDTISPIDGDEDDPRTYIRNPRKAPPWVVVHEVDDGAEVDLDVDPSETELYYYHKGAGPKLAQAVSEQYPEFDMSELIAANDHVRHKSGREMEAGIKDGEINPDPIVASMDVIAQYASLTADDDAIPVAEHVDAIVQGWADGGHEALEREYFKHSASKISVACALHRMRGKYMSLRSD